MASRAHEQALAAMLSHLALSFDGAILGAALAYAAVRSFLNFTANSKSLAKIRKAPTLSVSDLRSLLQNHDQDHQDQEQKLVIVRGQVEAKSAVDGSGKKSSRDSNVLLSHESGDKAVILQRTQTVPFALVEGGQWPQSDYVIVNMDGSSHPLPLTMVYHQLQPIVASRYTFIQALFGHEYPVGVLHEEKILPLGKCISAVGICNSKDGIPEIKSCKELPYFLADMTKDEMVADLAFKAKILLWSGIVLGSLSIGVLGFAVMRNWNKWKAWRQRRSQQPIHTTSDEDVSQIDDNEDAGDVPEGQLCVICLMRRRRAAFIPCGHLACCHTCAISVESEVSPKCPLCRQAVRNSIRIFEC
ncbi:E3 ubiquitin-protein ligase SPL2-like isoform X2 [Populus nigra]|uniref:E3 ubiquitin-protein ligase SPL2-like isoform X2 n=1 Tax=Populus nigra TaxID=3691 RepID=UPI002B2754C1|nr:E3 ubiquitin-protein ligase SPL2-like isoform X2 [Populus nigra]